MKTAPNPKSRNPFAKFLRSARKRSRRLREGGDERRFLNEVHGVIHVGANTGQEAPSYARLDIPVMWIEPLPIAFMELTKNIAPFHKQFAVQALVSDENNSEVDFHIAGESSSIFAFSGHRKLWPQIEATDVVRLSTTRLDRLMEDHNVATPPYDALVIDTQGAELLVLKGAGEKLRGFRRIVAEAADFEAYRGATNVDELTLFLSAIGFRLMHKAPMASMRDVGTYYNLYFSK